MPNKQPLPFFIFAILTILIGLNLRPIMGAIGPLMKDIQTTTLLSNTQASLLTTLPVAAMEIYNLCSPWLLSYMDSKKRHSFWVIFCHGCLFTG